MHLDERVQPRLAGRLDQLAQPFVVEGANDEQDRIGAEGAGLPDAVSVDDEVLAKQGDAHARRGHKVVVAAAEPRRLGENRDRGGAGSGVAAREAGDRPRTRPERLEGALGRRRALRLGDDRDAVRRAQDRLEAARLGHAAHLAPQLGQRDDTRIRPRPASRRGKERVEQRRRHA